MKIATGIIVLMWAAALPAYAGPGWQAITDPSLPAAGYDAGSQGKVVIQCDDNRGLHTYTLAISAPADALKDDAWTYATVAGKTVMMAVTVGDDGTATLTAASSLTRAAEGNPEESRAVYDAVAAMKRASSIRIDSGDFHIDVPAAGLETALADATATCGDPQKLAKAHS